MKKFQIGAILTAALAVGTLYAWTRLAAELSPQESAGEGIET